MTSTHADGSDETEGRPEAIRAVPVRHPWRWVSAGDHPVVLVVQLVNWAITNPALQWDVVGKYLFSDVDPARVSSPPSS